MRFLTVLHLNEKEKLQLIELWNEVYPDILQFKSTYEFDKYLSKLKDVRHTLLFDDANDIKGWFADFLRNDERWFVMMVSSDLQGKGYGSSFLNEAKKHFDSLSGWVICEHEYTKKNGKPYKPPVEFYEKNDFMLYPEVIFETDVLKTVKMQWKKN
ncbi:GNAT family N-acetyltransferase [Zhouia amylolytica]|uniref:GNAT family N-acetyltransferase n=1 Tax=Zhouia amylolytica TaxID=376730 RepID=UPI0020CE53DD|nr:GNAT family N-acetyltransferase [Zhouia amylolytica]MCQ0112140.1 GNAT family N-acetyltransferase [Zhouia amylolytica]